MTSKLEIRGKEVELCDCMATLRESCKGIDEVLARRQGEEFMKRLRRIVRAGEKALDLWAEIR